MLEYFAKWSRLLRSDILTLCFESKVVCQMSALMVSTEQEQRVGIPDLQGPEIQDALILRKD